MVTCRDCKLWDIEKARDSVGRIIRTARCLWKSKEQWPHSVNHSRPTAGHMAKTDGQRCPCFQPRPEEKP